jgi:hypothetical protein
MIRVIAFIACACLFINCSLKAIDNDTANENLLKQFIVHFIQEKIVEGNDTVFVVVKWDANITTKYIYIGNKLEITHKNTKCDYFQMSNNCVSFFDFAFNKNEFKKASFELTNGSTKVGYIKKESWGLDYKITSEMSR